jgi:hypothetical protein
MNYVRGVKKFLLLLQSRNNSLPVPFPYGKDEIIVTDIKGNFLGKTYVPSNIRIFSISKDKLYWLVENEDKEMWELYGGENKGSGKNHRTGFRSKYNRDWIR